MATPAFLLGSSAAAASSSQDNRNDGGAAQDGLPPPPDPVLKDSFLTRPKPRKVSKAAAPKRPPQRGLGVAQLERLRLQERWKKDPAREVHPFPVPLPVYDFPAAYCAPVPPPAPAAVATYGGGWVQAPGMCYIQQCLQASPGLAGYGGAASSTVRSVVHEQYSLDRYRVGMAGGEGRFQVGSPFPEPPSNQKMQCFSDQCEFCARVSSSTLLSTLIDIRVSMFLYLLLTYLDGGTKSCRRSVCSATIQGLAETTAWITPRWIWPPLWPLIR